MDPWRGIRRVARPGAVQDLRPAHGVRYAGPTLGVHGGAGGTLGPGMTVGFIAGRHAAQRR